MKAMLKRAWHLEWRFFLKYQILVLARLALVGIESQVVYYIALTASITLLLYFGYCDYKAITSSTKLKYNATPGV